MKREENIAESYLRSIGLSEIIYEPDGNVPPDFSAEERIAIEVRRLNQNEITASGGTHGLENLRFALHRCIAEILRSLGPPKNGKSWFVHYTFERPLSPLPQIRIKVQRALEEFRDGRAKTTELSIFDGFELHLLPASKVFPHHFVLGAIATATPVGFSLTNSRRTFKFASTKKRPRSPKCETDIQSGGLSWWTK